ncbi:YciI family protein [Rhodobacter sp. 24-YEA-8]|uniref:YciI family protein n=1 Tax=Rhodobacter sp. 24-YEA-8 TaxID=1884310 RepID=UPI0014960FFF|nr:YciI family protein [Rhodobacter sp. 24-YEA-8]
MILVYRDPDLEPARDAPGFREMVDSYLRANERMKADGVWRAGAGLQGAETSTILQLRGGSVRLGQAPYLPGKEQLAGYYILDVADAAAAAEYAKLLPPAQYGTIEIRPLKIYPPSN